MAAFDRSLQIDPDRQEKHGWRTHPPQAPAHIADFIGNRVHFFRDINHLTAAVSDCGCINSVIHIHLLDSILEVNRSALWNPGQTAHISDKMPAVIGTAPSLSGAVPITAGRM